MPKNNSDIRKEQRKTEAQERKDKYDKQRLTTAQRAADRGYTSK